jgi:hypothetical protein
VISWALISVSSHAPVGNLNERRLTGASVRNWEFFRPTVGLVPGFGGEINPLKLLRRRGSLVVADIPMSSLSLGMKAGGAGKPQPPPGAFEEPDSSSLLDSFGF